MTGFVAIAKAILELTLLALSPVLFMALAAILGMKVIGSVERNWEPETGGAMRLLSAWAGRRGLELLEAVPTSNVWTHGVSWKQRRFSVIMRDANGNKYEGIAMCGDRSFGRFFDSVEVEWSSPAKPGADLDFE